MKTENQKKNIDKNPPQSLIKKLRMEWKLSLRDVADKANISPAFLSEIERGTRKPSPETLEAIAVVLGHRNALFANYGLLTREMRDLLLDKDVYLLLSKLAKISKIKRTTFLEVIKDIFSETQ